MRHRNSLLVHWDFVLLSCIRRSSFIEGHCHSVFMQYPLAQSLVATSAPNQFAGIRRPRPLTHGTAHRIVAPRTFSLLKIGASRAGNVDGRLSGTSESAGPFSFLQASQIFTFVARKILGAK